MAKKNTWSNIDEIYSRLGDEKSKFIFRKRLEYSLCNSNAEPLADILGGVKDEANQTILTLIQRRMDYKDKDLILFGCGRWGGFYLDLINSYRIGKPVAFCDNNQEVVGKTFKQLPVVSVEDAVRNENAVFVITSHDYRASMKKQLLDMGIAEERIFLYAYTTKIFGDQYFDKEIIVPCENGVFIDGGCFNLYDSFNYIKFNPKYKRIYAFEPDLSNYKECLKRVKESKLEEEKITIYHKALWSSITKLSFQSDNGSSSISEKGATLVSTVDIDSICYGKEKVTFIKMDIEGAELEALKGAAKTIQADHPSLAICVYHKKGDIIEIPEYILSLNPNYRLYLRHYSVFCWETVLYAVDGN